MTNLLHVAVFTGRKKAGRMKQVCLTTQLKVPSVKEKEQDKKVKLNMTGNVVAYEKLSLI